MELKKLIESHPLIEQMAMGTEVFWENPNLGSSKSHPFTTEHIADAEARLNRFAPYLRKVFPETQKNQGIIESPLVSAPHLKEALEKKYQATIPGRLLIKCDSHLPVSGSIKARGGIYEVLKLAETIAFEAGLLSENDDYSILTDEPFLSLFSKYKVAVGSTGNLGLSIGIISAKLGFKATIHMSADARQWKKDMLRSKGVQVIEYPEDYQKAVAEGRKQAENDNACHFVDDEGSEDLFLGYSTAGKRLEKQLKDLKIIVDEDHPLFVYLPCGVGGGPGGVAFGIKNIFKEDAHCFFAEPTQAPCMLLGMMTQLHDQISVFDIGLHGKTAADGLAVGRPSRLVGSIMDSLLDGSFTIKDDELYRLLKLTADAENLYIEPSGCAGFTGPIHLLNNTDFLEFKRLSPEKLENSTHILWATGGNMVPTQEMNHYYQKGADLLK